MSIHKKDESRGLSLLYRALRLDTRNYTSLCTVGLFFDLIVTLFQFLLSFQRVNPFLVLKNDCYHMPQNMFKRRFELE